MVFKYRKRLSGNHRVVRQTLFYAAQFGLVILALAHHLLKFGLAQCVARQLGLLSALVAQSFAVLHSLASGIQQCLGIVLNGGQRGLRLAVGLALLGAGYQVVKVRYVSLAHLKMAVGLLRVEHGWHKPRPVVSAREQS